LSLIKLISVSYAVFVGDYVEISASVSIDA